MAAVELVDHVAAQGVQLVGLVVGAAGRSHPVQGDEAVRRQGGHDVVRGGERRPQRVQEREAGGGPVGSARFVLARRGDQVDHDHHARYAEVVAQLAGAVGDQCRFDHLGVEIRDVADQVLQRPLVQQP